MSQVFGNGGRRPGNRMSLAQEMLWTAAGGRYSLEDFSLAVARMEGTAPRGAQLVPPDLITAAQRVRVMTGMLAAITELSWFNVNIESVTKRARVARNVFYQYFESKEHCFVVAYQLTGKLLVGRMGTAASRRGGDWEERLRGAIAELLYFAAYEPVGMHALLAGRNALCAQRHHDALLEQLAQRLGKLAKEGTGTAADEVTLGAVVGGVEYLLYCALDRLTPAELTDLAPEVASFCLRPIAGLPRA